MPVCSQSAALAAVVAAPAPASASQMIARNATHVRLAVNRNHVALLTYRSEGVCTTRSPGARSTRARRRAGCRQVSFRLDYSGGWGSRRKDLWRGFRTSAAPTRARSSTTSSPRARRPTARTGSSRSGAACCRRSASAPRSRSGPTELHLSHWSGELPEFVVKVDWVYKRYDHLYGWLKYKGKGVYGFRATRYGSPLDKWGRNVFVDTYNSRYGRGWKRENGFLTHRGDRRLLLRLLSARQPPGRQGQPVPGDRDGPRSDADHVLAGPCAGPVRPRRSTS